MEEFLKELERSDQLYAQDLQAAHAYINDLGLKIDAQLEKVDAAKVIAAFTSQTMCNIQGIVIDEVVFNFAFNFY